MKQNISLKTLIFNIFREFTEDNLTLANTGANIVSLTLEDRRNLCIAARERTTVHFLDYNVPPAQFYEFSNAGRK